MQFSMLIPNMHFFRFLYFFLFFIDFVFVGEKINENTKKHFFTNKNKIDKKIRKKYIKNERNAYLESALKTALVM